MRLTTPVYRGIIPSGASFHFNPAEPLSSQGNSGVWSLQCRQMATPVEHNQAGSGNESADLRPVLHGGEAIFTAPNQKRRAGDADQIGPSITPGE